MGKLLAVKPDLDICENPLEKLLKERELLGDFVSGHPLDHYAAPSKLGAIEIGKALMMDSGRKISVTGIISDFRVRNRRADGANFGVFKIRDKTGEIESCCFTKQFPDNKKNLYNDAVVKIDGRLMEDSKDPEKRKISVDKATILSPLKNVIVIFAKDIDDWEQNVKNRAKTYVAQNGNPTRVYDLMMDEYRICDLLVTPSIVNDTAIKAGMTNMRI